MIYYSDAHCHINNDFNSATIAGVGLFICNATQPEQWNQVADMAAKNQSVFGCVGIHPWFISNITPGWKKQMIDILNANPNIMVGEIGLDKYWPDISRQIEIMTEQIDIANQFNRVVHIHCVGAWDKILQILKHTTPPRAIVAHAFNGGWDIAKTLMDKYNVYFSFGVGNKSERIRDCIVKIPSDRILVESDDVGSTNIPKIVETIAKIRNISDKDLASITKQNIMRITQ